MAGYVREIDKRFRVVQKLWSEQGVGPPGLATDVAMSQVLDVVSILESLWWSESENTVAGMKINKRAVDLVDEGLGHLDEHGRCVVLWRDFEAIMRREVELSVADSETFTDSLIASTGELALATARVWGDLSDVPNSAKLFGDARALLSRTERIAEDEDLRRVAARVRAKEAELDAVVETAQTVLETQREAVGETGSLSLATHFSGLADAESKRADFFLGSAIAVVVAFIIVVGFFVPHTDVSITELLSRVLVAVPGFGLAAYLAREGGRHRHVAQWAKSLEVQLKTVDAFGAPMTTADVSQVRKVFAARAFGAMPAPPGRGPAEDSPTPVDLQAIIERLITELRAKG